MAKNKPFSLAAELSAEFLGTLVLVLFGCGSVAMVVLFGLDRPHELVNGGWTNINLGWGLGVAMGIYVAGRISGAHLNPAVTLALAVFRGFPWSKVVPFAAAQTAGAFLAAALVYWNYLPAFHKFDPQLERTAGVFGTFPTFAGEPGAGLLDQFLGTALLMLLILAITDSRNPAANATWTPWMIGMAVVAIGISFGGMHGYAVNPARDLGPRLFTVLAGFKHNGLTDGTGVFWVPIVGPLAGAVAGAGLYDFAIGRFLPPAATQNTVE